MGILKNFKHGFFIMIFISNLSAQSNKWTGAFSKSYDFETNKKYDEAISVLINIYESSSYELNLRIAYLNYLNGKNQEAIVYYQKASDIMLGSTEALWGLIKPLAALERWNEVERTYLSIIKLDPKNSLANYYLGLIYYYRKNFISAKKYFDVSLNLYPFDYNNLLMSAWNNYFLGSKNEARSLFNKVLLNKPNDSSALEGLSLVN